MIDMTKPAFQPAPRPRPRTSPEEAQQLAASASDLGFSRTSSAPEAGSTEALTPEPISTKTQIPKYPIGPMKAPL